MLTLLDPAAAEPAKELDGLLLALATAGVYLEQVTTTFAGYLRSYKKSWLKLQQKSSQISILDLAAIARSYYIAE